MQSYREIWKEHFGEIPTDENGRKYEIHHINGDRDDDSPENLLCVSIKDHYNIHKEQGDYAACLLISTRMDISPEEKSELASAANHRRLQEGSHPFLDDEVRERIVDGIHERIEAGTFHLLKEKRDPEWTVKAQRTYNGLHDRSECAKRGWNHYKMNNDNWEERTLKGSQIGAKKTRGTKWFHKDDGSQLRAEPTDPRIEEEGWKLGRYKGSELMKYASSHKTNFDKSPQTIEKQRNTVIERNKKKYSHDRIKESLDKSNNRTEAVLYFNTNFDKISYPTFKRYEEMYNLN